MDRIDVAKGTVELSQLLCKDLKEIWESHTDEDIKKQYSFEEIESTIKKMGE